MGETIKVGLRWAGNPANSRDRERSVPLAKFAGLAGLPQLSFVSLAQVPPSEAERAAAEALGLIDVSAELADFTDTAALVANLDLVIAVDTAVLHLAGALGRPAWGLLRFSPHWPWLLGRSDSPWYPSLRLFRQSRAGDWDGVLAEVAALLTESMRQSTEGG
jgi:ADP-heptose:LPS heptosyltransferase